MNAHPKAIHAATGNYYVTTDGYHASWIIVCPDGTKYGTHTYLGGRSMADAECDRLNAQDREDRAMTDATQSVVAIIRSTMTQYGDNPHDIWAAWQDLYRMVCNPITEPPATEPITEDEPAFESARVTCPACGEDDEWASVETVSGLAGMHWDDASGQYEYDGGTDIDWNNQAATGRYECRACGYQATAAEIRAEVGR